MSSGLEALRDPWLASPTWFRICRLPQPLFSVFSSHQLMKESFESLTLGSFCHRGYGTEEGG